MSKGCVGESPVTRNASNLAAENSVLKQAARSAGFGCGRACNVQGLKTAAISERQRVPEALNLLLLGRWIERLQSSILCMQMKKCPKAHQCPKAHADEEVPEGTSVSSASHVSISSFFLMV